MSSASPDYKALYEKAILEKEAALEKAELAQRIAEQKQQQAEAYIRELTEKLSLSLFELDRLRRKLFSRSADNRSKFTDPNQIILFDLGISEEEQQASDEQAKKDIEKTDKPAGKKREKNTRMELPADLPRQEVVIHPTQDLTNYVRIGEEVTEVLEITPPAFYVKRITRTKWALKTSPYSNHDLAEQSTPGVILAWVPRRTITRGIFGDSLLAYLVIGKYIDHLPLYRQIKIFERLGIHLAASTVSDAIAAVCRLLEPLYNSLKREVLANKYLQADETTIRVQDGEKQGACHLGYFWAYHAPVAKLVLFDYQKSRGQEGPAKILADFGGVLQTDGYGLYSSLFDKNPNITLAGCMAHVRRKFDEAVRDDAVRGKYVVDEIAKLYGIEKQIRESPHLTELEICHNPNAASQSSSRESQKVFRRAVPERDTEQSLCKSACLCAESVG